MDENLDPTVQTDTPVVESELAPNTRKQTWRAIVSLEPITSPVKTWRGELSGTNGAVIANRAVRAARKAFPGTHAKSLTIVVEKL